MPSSTMIWILVICLLVDGGASTDPIDGESTEPEHSPDSILQINKNMEADDPHGNGPNLFEGDILKRSLMTSYSAKRFLWSTDRNTSNVIIPYNISKDYEEYHRFTIFQAFKGFEATTCIRFVERTIEKDYIYIFPGIGCYSSVGRVGGRQPVSLAFECVQKGKGVVMHELLHVIGFWHEHSRADRDDYVTIMWSAIDKNYWSNFCKYQTTNMIVKYDIGSLLHYSSIAFTKTGAQTILSKESNSLMGQRSRLSASDIRRVNKMYKCAQYVASPDDSTDLVVPEDISTGTTCPEAKMADSVKFTNDLASTENILLAQEQSTVSSSKESNTGQDVLYSSAPVSTKVFSKESTSVANGFMYSNILHRSTEQPPTEPPKRTAAPESTHEDNSTVLNTTKATEQLAGDHSTAFTISAVGSSVNNSEILFRSTTQSTPKRTRPNVDIVESHTTLHTSASCLIGEKREQTTAEDIWSASGSGETPNVSYEDQEYVKENLPKAVQKRSLDWKTLGSLSEHPPRWIHGYKLTPSSQKSSNGSLIIEPFCGFEHGLCGWKQSREDDLDWRLVWRKVPFGPEGFHLSLKHSPEKSVLGQKALLLRPVVQPSNCISFWYGSRNSVKGTLNVYITSSGGEQALLWSSGGQDHAKWTKAQIMLPPPLLPNHAHVVLEGVLGPSYRSNIAIDDLYVGQCS